MYHVYILANERNGTLYIGVTSDLTSRISQHKEAFQTTSFTSQYKVHQLVHAEEFESIFDAIKREKQLKSWKRSWKIRLIEEENPSWKDLSILF